jgi:translation initiation factor 3 subunit K
MLDKKKLNIEMLRSIFSVYLFIDQTLKHWVKKYGWREEDSGMIFIANQDENIKTKNITEKIDFENAAAIMAASR